MSTLVAFVLGFVAGFFVHGSGLLNGLLGRYGG